MDSMPGTRIKVSVLMTIQRKYFMARFRTMRMRVMAKATLLQLVAIVVNAVDVFWYR